MENYNFNAIDFCDDYNIEYASSGKHFRQGWTNIQCPFCGGSTGYHLGINTSNGYANCYKCGGYNMFKVISTILKTSTYETKQILKKYSGGSRIISSKKETRNIPSELVFPSDIKPITQAARDYLIDRNFNPDQIASTWGILSTPHWGFYRNRILAPIYQHDKLVSFQTRDITGTQPQKYLACFQNDELIPHQQCVYGFDLALGRKTCIVVEGITDVWRLGPGAIGTFGIGFTRHQARLIADNFERVHILYDSEIQAQEKAEELGFLISSGFKNPVEVINLSFTAEGKDPGDLSQDDADEIMKEIGLK